MADQTNAEVSDERTVSGETVMGMPVTAYMEETEFGGKFATHWSTIPEHRNPVRLFAEDDVRALLTRRSVTSQASEGAVARGAEDNPANVADAILRQVRRTLAAEKKHASFPPGSTETSRDDADFEYSILAGFSLAQVDAALAVVRRRKDASPSKRVERLETALKHIADGKMADYRDFARQALQGGRS